MSSHAASPLAPRRARISFPALATLLAAGLALPGCAQAPDDDTPEDEAFLSGGKADGGIEEGSADALGVLAVVNTLSQVQLDDDVGLDGRAARGIVRHRQGGDGSDGTADDDRFDTLVELDAISYVGRAAFARLLEYARDHGFVMVGGGGGGWVMENPGPDAVVRHDVWAASATLAWAVGDHGLVERWDGATWTVVPSSTDVTLNAVWGSGPSNVWMVGAQGTILRWDGTRLAPVASGTTRTLFDVSGTGPSDVWMVGQSDAGALYGLILRWDGAALRVQRASSCPNSLYAVHARGPGDVWVGGGVKTVCHFDGTGWSYRHVTSTWQDSITDLWQGPTGPLWAIFSGEVWRLDGETWARAYQLPDTADWTVPGLLRLAAGADGTLIAGGSHGYLARFDGTAWSASRLPGDASYRGVAVAGGTGWAVGPAARARLQGGAWRESYQVATRQWLREVVGTSTSNLYALGSEGALVRRAAGGGWTQVDMPLGIDDHPAALTLTTDGVLWMSGSFGAASFDGASFTSHDQPRSMRRMYGRSNDLWAVGEYGMAHYDGTTWRDVARPDGVIGPLLAVDGTSGQDVWAVGTGNILHYDGTSWRKVNLDDPERSIVWTAVVAIAPDDVWVAGESQQVRHWDGTSWRSITATPQARPYLSSGWAAGPDDVWFVENGRGLLHWDGTAFTATALDGAAGVVGIPGAGLWVTGQEGVIARGPLP